MNQFWVNLKLPESSFVILGIEYSWRKKEDHVYSLSLTEQGREKTFPCHIILTWGFKLLLEPKNFRLFRRSSICEQCRLPITFAVRLILSDEELCEFAPRHILPYSHQKLCTAVIYSYCYVHSVPPLELRGWVRRLYLRITIFDADERWGVVVSPGSSVTKEDLSCKHWKHWNGIKNVFSSFHLKIEQENWAFLLITALPVSVKSTVEGTVGGGEGRRRGGG